MSDTARLDHAVINVRSDMDRAERLFAALGFTVTPRGHHTLGSINHLMIFGSDYLELIGLPPGREAGRPELAAAPLGPNGLVFKTDDVDATYDHLQTIGMAGDPPRSFSRPLDLPGGGPREVGFRTVHVRPGLFPAGRVYFCEHLTPELVWRPEWQEHRNGAARLEELVIVCAAPEREAERYRQLLSATASGGDGHEAGIELDGSHLALLSPGRYRERYGRLASSLEGRESIFGAIVLEASGVGAVAGLAEGATEPTAVTREENRVTVRVAAFDTVLEFVGA